MDANASPGGGDHRPRRRKLPSIDLSNGETPETTAEYGAIFLTQLRDAKDKRGRQVVANFLTLPDKAQNPEYYAETKLPIALDTIEAKLKRKEYPNLTALESDAKRLVANAKAVYPRESEHWNSAERIRKIIWEFMRRTNPAYENPEYTAVPTPIPGEEVQGGVSAPAPAPPKSVTKPAAKPPPSPSASASASASAPNGRAKMPAAVETVAPEAEEERKLLPTASTKAGIASFVGKSFQEAQDMIIEEMIRLKNEDGDIISDPFLNLPPRKLTDYYALIKKPISLKGIQKRVRGVHGRQEATGVSDYKSWEAFIEDVSLIWRNAREYNEDGSAIFVLAGKLEEYFIKRLAEAKAVVQDPRQLEGEPKGAKRLKLTLTSSKPPPTEPAQAPPPPLPQKITLRVGAASRQGPATTTAAISTSSTANPTNDPQVAIDDDSLRRQQLHVQAGIHGMTSTTAATTATKAADSAPAASGQPAGADKATAAASTERPTGDSTTAPAAGALASPASPPATAAAAAPLAAPVSGEQEQHAAPAPGSVQKKPAPVAAATTTTTTTTNVTPPSANSETTASVPGAPANVSIMQPPPLATVQSASERASQEQALLTASHAPVQLPTSVPTDSRRSWGNDPLIRLVDVVSHPSLNRRLRFFECMGPSPFSWETSFVVQLPRDVTLVEVGVVLNAHILRDRNHRLTMSAGLPDRRADVPIVRWCDNTAVFNVTLAQRLTHLSIELVACRQPGETLVEGSPTLLHERFALILQLLD